MNDIPGKDGAPRWFPAALASGKAEPGPWSPTLILMLVLTAASFHSAAAQPACRSPRLEEANAAYDVGRFAEIVDVLDPCLPEGFREETQRIDAYRLMALSYIATDSLEQARLWIERLLKVNTRYQPDPLANPPFFVDYVRSRKPKWYSWLWRGSEWYKWAGRGLLAGGIVSLPFLLKGNAEPELPGPPAFPPH